MTKRSVRNYEVVIALIYAKEITAAVAVVEDGEATYAIGKLSLKELLAYKEVFDVAYGAFNRETDRVKTEGVLEDLEADGVEIFGTRYLIPKLQLKFPRHDDIVEKVLVDYLKQFRLPITKHPRPLHIRFLQRMRPRNGYLMRRGGLDDK